MADHGRESWSDKISRTVKPDSQKTLAEQTGDKATGQYENVASTAQPESQKSYGQKAMDMVSGNGPHTGTTSTTGHTGQTGNTSSSPLEHRTFIEKVEDTLHLGSHKH